MRHPEQEDAERAEVGRFVEAMLRSACEFEGLVMEAGGKIRDRSKVAYGPLLDARVFLMGGLAHLFMAKSGVPGRTSRSISDRLTLLSAFVQGAYATETLISEGQYAKAAAVLKQDYETLARFREVRDGTAKAGTTPNVKNAPDGSRHLYGELNKIAHPSNEHLLTDLLGRVERGEIRGVSPIPEFKADVAKGLYEIHIFTLIYALREAIGVFMEMYPGDKIVEPALRAFVGGTECAERAGFKVEEEAPGEAG